MTTNNVNNSPVANVLAKNKQYNNDLTRFVNEKDYLRSEWSNNLNRSVLKTTVDQKIIELFQDCIKAAKKASNNRCWQVRVKTSVALHYSAKELIKKVANYLQMNLTFSSNSTKCNSSSHFLYPHIYSDQHIHKYEIDVMWTPGTELICDQNPHNFTKSLGSIYSQKDHLENEWNALQKGESPHPSDLVPIESGGKTIYASKSILSFNSKLFKDIIEKKIELPKIDPQVLYAVIKFIHTKGLNDSDIKNIGPLNLFLAGHKFGVKGLKLFALDCLIKYVQKNKLDKNGRALFSDMMSFGLKFMEPELKLGGLSETTAKLLKVCLALAEDHKELEDEYKKLIGNHIFDEKHFEPIVKICKENKYMKSLEHLKIINEYKFSGMFSEMFSDMKNI